MPRPDDTPARKNPRPKSSRRLSARIIVPLTALMALSMATVPAAADEAEAAAQEAETADFENYVALGDSFTAGPFISDTGDIETNAPLLGCMRSESNYPQLLAEGLEGTELTDVSCSGAVMEHFYEDQFDDAPPQLDALTPETDLVTVGISGNDFGFAEIFLECAGQSLGDPGGSPCADHYGDELDDRVEELREDVSQVYADIAERSPDATVLSVGYLQILPETDGCWPTVPVSEGDVPFLDEAQIALNAMIDEEATAQGATFVDVYERGHDACQPSDTRWVEGLIPGNEAAPVHPNLAGMVATTDFLREELGLADPA